jgi:hypothetical protein
LVRVFIFALLFAGTLFADLLDDKIRSFMDKREYIIQQKLINIIFSNRDSFYKNEDLIDSVAVIKELKKNGLIELFFDKPKDFVLTFHTQKNPLIFMKIINDSLSSMGYNYYLTKEAIKDKNGFKWSISLKTEFVIDPIFFANELSVYNCEILDINKLSQTHWKYEIDTANAKIGAIRVELDTSVKLKKPIEPYWIDVQNADSIELLSHRLDHWYPYIVFYDKNLHIVKYYKYDYIKKRVKFEIPKTARYIKVADLFTLNNIKRGLRVYLISE